jgi:hypothetical protein
MYTMTVAANTMGEAQHRVVPVEEGLQRPHVSAKQFAKWLQLYQKIVF